MAWLVQTMKDVASCDKLRLGASSLWPADFRMRQLTWGNTQESALVQKVTWGSETSQYPEEEKPNGIPIVAASEKGIAQTQ